MAKYSQYWALLSTLCGPVKVVHLADLIKTQAFVHGITHFRGLQDPHVVAQHFCIAQWGDGQSGTQALAAKYNGSIPAVLEQRTDLTPELVRTFVRQGMNIMPPFRKTEISDAELNALATYLARKGSH